MKRGDMRELEAWIEKHPRLAWVYTAGVAILICEIAGILDQLLKRVH